MIAGSTTAGPYSERYWSEVETWPVERIREWQLTALRDQLSYVGERSAFYRRRWKDLGFEPGDVRGLEDLRRLPVVTKADYVAEIVDPETLEPVPDGTPGALILTHLDKQATPLVRWWTGDIVVRDGTPCGCGRTHARLPGGVAGRADDMLVVRGVNLFPSAVEQVVRRTEGTTGEYLIVLDKDVTDPVTGYLTGIKLRVEVEPGVSADFAAGMAAAIRAELTVRCVAESVPEGTLPRSTHKSKRVVRQH